MNDTFTVVSRGWHGLKRRRLVLAVDAVDAEAAYREQFPGREIVAVVVGPYEELPNPRWKMTAPGSFRLPDGDIVT